MLPKIISYSPDPKTDTRPDWEYPTYEVLVQFDGEKEPKQHTFTRLKLEWYLYLQRLFEDGIMNEEQVRELDDWRFEWFSEGYDEGQTES